MNIIDVGSQRNHSLIERNFQLPNFTGLLLCILSGSDVASEKVRRLQVTDRSSTFLREFLRKYHYFSSTKEKYLSEAGNKSQAKRARNLINIHPEYIYTILKKTVYIKMTAKQMVISQIKPYEQSFIPTKWTRCKIY